MASFAKPGKGGHLVITHAHAHTVRRAKVNVGWLALRLPDRPHRPLRALVADDTSLDRQLTLITNVPIVDEETARTVHVDWRDRPR